jgi:hypothetical protein
MLTNGLVFLRFLQRLQIMSQNETEMTGQLLAAMEASEKDKALEYFDAAIQKGHNAWDIHLAMFPIVQQVINPPYINPHLPKMYGVCREFIPYLEPGEEEPLVRLEVSEYTRRSKLGEPSVDRSVTPTIHFHEIEAAIGDDDEEKTATLLLAFHANQGARELARRLLLLGGGHLDQSIGHSISCTAFILLEMLERMDKDPLPSLFALAHYFCKGRFHTISLLTTVKPHSSEDILALEALKATSGVGFVNIHHTITLYAIERVSHLLAPDEYRKLLAACATFISQKEIRQVNLGAEAVHPPADYEQFYQMFSGMETTAAVQSLIGLTDSETGRRVLGHFLIKGVCDLYDGAYNPHYLTGLGATLWAVNRFQGNRKIAVNALNQYLDFFFNGLKSNK